MLCFRLKVSRYFHLKFQQGGKYYNKGCKKGIQGGKYHKGCKKGIQGGKYHNARAAKRVFKEENITTRAAKRVFKEENITRRAAKRVFKG